MENTKTHHNIAIQGLTETRKCAKRGCKTPAGNRIKFCSKHNKQAFAKKFPLKYSYDNLRNRARQRRIEFNLTYEEYEKFCKETGYDKKKGRKKNSLTIDRKDVTKGYEYDNLQALTKSENSAKMHVDYAELKEHDIYASNDQTEDPF